MKYLLVVLSLLAFNVQATNDIKGTRQAISGELNSTVKELKKKLLVVDNSLSSAKTDISKMQSDAERLVESSKELELNPTVLQHGEKDLKPCNDNEELYWDNAWKCRLPSYATDCTAASDEYKYTVDGKEVCTKHAEGQPLNYKWEYRGITPSCQSNTYKRKVYRCYYVNKNGQEVDVDVAKCGKTDEFGENASRCTSTWVAGSWGGCSASCGSGTKSRSVTCKANHYCPGAKPSSSTSCNAGACRSSGGGSDNYDVYDSNGNRKSKNGCSGNCSQSKPSSSSSSNSSSSGGGSWW